MKARIVKEHYPFVEIVSGDLDDTQILEAESEKADIVLSMLSFDISLSLDANLTLFQDFANCDHLSAAEAIIRGASKRKMPCYVLHTSGAKIIAWKMESQPQTWGEYIPHPYDDWNGVRKLTEVSSSDRTPGSVLPHWAAHRDVDLAILHGHRNHPGIVRTAIICPPTVYGPSRFPLFTRSIQLPRMLNVFLRRRRAFTIKDNKNVWNMIHTQDISEMYVLLTEAAVDQRPGDLWDEYGYYFSEQGEFVWGDVIREAARIGYQKGLFDSPVPESLTNEQVSRFWFGGQMNVSSTSLGSAQRASKLLGWKPTSRNIFEDIDRTLDAEAKLLGA